MTSEMRDLSNKAQNGDLESQYYLGRAYAFAEKGFSQNIPEALKWLNIAGEKYAAPLKNIIGIYMGAAGDEHRNARGIIETLQKIIDIHDDILARINLGLIYTGNPNDGHIALRKGGLPELLSFCNPKLGYKLIEEGVAKAEGQDDNPLKYSVYEAIQEAYHHDTQKRYKDSSSMFFQDFGHLIALAKKVIYGDRALDALNAGKGTEDIPQENLSPLIALAYLGLDSSKGELLSILKGDVSQDQLIDTLYQLENLYGGSSQNTQDYIGETMREINKLRSTGEYNGISFAGKQELADVLELFLRVAIDESKNSPNEQTSLQSQDMSKTEVIQDLNTSAGSSNQASSTTAPGVESLMKRGWLYLEDGDWKRADEYFDRVLDIDPEYAEAYMGKLCAKLKVAKEENLAKLAKPFGGDSDYKKALRFAKGSYRSKIEGYNQTIQEQIAIKERIEKERLARKKRKAEERLADEKRRQEEQLAKTKREQEEQLAKTKREQDRWIQQGLCKYCGSPVGGLFTKKCKSKSCGKTQ